MGWFYKIEETEHGPVPEEEIIDLFRAGNLSVSPMIKEDDSIAWRRIDQSEIGRALGVFQDTIMDANDRILDIDPAKTKRLGWRQVMMTIMLFLFLVCAFISMIGSGMLIHQLSGFFDVIPSEDVITIASLAWALGVLGMAALLLPCLVFYAFFIHQATKNIRLMGAVESSFSPLWSWLFLIIPIMNLFKPMQAVSQAWSASHRFSGVSDTGNWRIGVWWFSWLAGGFLFRVADLLITDGINNAERESLLNGHYFSLVSVLLYIISTVMLLQIFNRISRLQRTFADMKLADTFT